jgi:type I pantothenate kinase
LNPQLTQILQAYRLPVGRPLIVGLAGSVAAGKTTLAKQMATAWQAKGTQVEVVSTDGFLHPNAELSERGLLLRKGFPESYDAARLAAFLDDIRAGRPTSVPIYSHQTYDVLSNGRELAPADVVIVEGINALQPVFTAGKLDGAIYLDAAEDDLFHWYYERGNRLREAARADPTSFFVRYLALSDAEWDAQLRKFWVDINLPNLHSHIAPSRTEAHFHLVKQRDHQIVLLPKIAAAETIQT